jgi:hypothetical protein
MGQAQVLVPAGVCVVASSHVGAGESEVTGERNSGFDVDTSVGDAAAGAGGGAATVPRLVLNAVLDAGQLQVLDGDSTSGERPDACPPRAVAAANRTPRHD